MAGRADPHRTRDANDGWRRWLAEQTPIEREMRTMGGGADWQSRPPSNARSARQAEETVHPNQSLDGNKRWRCQLAHHNPIEHERGFILLPPHRSRHTVAGSTSTILRTCLCLCLCLARPSRLNPPTTLHPTSWPPSFSRSRPAPSYGFGVSADRDPPASS